MSEIRKVLIRQFDRMWDMLRQAIDNIPDDHWNDENQEWLYSKVAYNIIVTADFYSRDTHEGFDWEKQRIKFKDYSAKEQQLSFLEAIKLKVANRLEKFTVQELMAKDGFHWFYSRLEKFLYLLRHNAHHIGELAHMLRIWRAERVKWT
jgi:hypothetical protein